MGLGAVMERLFQEIMALFRGIPDIYYYIVMIGGAICLLGWWCLGKPR